MTKISLNCETMVEERTQTFNIGTKRKVFFNFFKTSLPLMFTFLPRLFSFYFRNRFTSAPNPLYPHMTYFRTLPCENVWKNSVREEHSECLTETRTDVSPWPSPEPPVIKHVKVQFMSDLVNLGLFMFPLAHISKSKLRYFLPDLEPEGFPQKSASKK